MIFTKIIRKKDKKVFWIREDADGEKYLCTSSQRMVKHLRDVRDFYNRFRYFIIGIDDDNFHNRTCKNCIFFTYAPNTRIYDCCEKGINSANIDFYCNRFKEK